MQHAHVLAFILRRILQSIAVMGVVALIAFALFNFTGDPVVFMVGQDATAEEKAQLRAELQRAMGQTEDHPNATAAFVAKQKPTFLGR